MFLVQTINTIYFCFTTDPALSDYIPMAPVNDEAKKHNQNLPGMGGIYNTVNFHLYHYAGNNPVKYIDPDGRDIREAGLYSVSVGAFGAARMSAGLAKDSNHKIAIFLKLETGMGFGGSIIKLDKMLPTFSRLFNFMKDVEENIEATDMVVNSVPDSGKGNFTGFVTTVSETVFDWIENKQAVPAEGAFIVGAEGNKDGKLKVTVGATAVASFYLREDTLYFDISRFTNFIQKQINKLSGE